MRETRDDLMSVFLCEKDRLRGHQRPLSGASVICIKVMQPAANDITGHERAPGKTPGPVPMCEERKRRGKSQRRGSKEK